MAKNDDQQVSLIQYYGEHGAALLVRIFFIIR